MIYKSGFLKNVWLRGAAGVNLRLADEPEMSLPGKMYSMDMNVFFPARKLYVWLIFKRFKICDFYSVLDVKKKLLYAFW